MTLKTYKHESFHMVEQFDRMKAAGGVKKRHIIDGCKAFDMPPENKYEQNFGLLKITVAHFR